jgi:NhaP-type Na+/H+ or K+/H+ antiporter
MESALTIVFVGALVFLAHLFVALFEKTRVPDVVYLVAIGLVIGPIFNIVSPGDFGKVGNVFTTIALVVILFEGGLELSLEVLWRSVRTTVTTTFVVYTLGTVVCTYLVVQLTDLSLPLSLFAGAVIAAPAPAVVIPIVRQLQLSPASQTILTLESPLGEAVSIVFALAVLDALRLDVIHPGRLAGGIFASLLIALLLGVIAGFVWSVLLHRVRQLRYAIFTTPAFLFILYGVTEFLGFSGPVSALAFGVTLGNVGSKEFPTLTRRYGITPLQHNETERAFFGEIVFLIKTFFFVYLGLSIQLSDSRTLLLGVGLTGALLVTRFLSIRFTVRRDLTVRKESLLMGVMVPKGTAAAVLAAIPAQMGIAGGEALQNLIYSVVLASLLVTGLLVFAIDRFVGPRRAAGAPPEAVSEEVLEKRL